jgi:hypothetical protein
MARWEDLPLANERYDTGWIILSAKEVRAMY